MAYFDTTRPSLTGSFGRTLAIAAARVSAWREARVTRATLGALSDRELADIGLQRSDFDEMSRQGLSRF